MAGPVPASRSTGRHAPDPPEPAPDPGDPQDHEQVLEVDHAESGLRAIIAIHSTTLGPALGGTRMRPYRTHAEAHRDVLRLSRAMTQKAALAGLPLGGGKAVIIGDPATDRNQARLLAYGRAVESLGGRFVTAEDMGLAPEDIDVVARTTRFTVGGSRARGGSGDPSPWTALGVQLSIAPIIERLDGRRELDGVRVVVSGVGKVGRALARGLVDLGARVLAADVDERALARIREMLAVETVAADGAHRVECDVYAPCATGGVLNRKTIPELRCRAVVGSANNQLATAADGALLAEAGILYAPDYLVNAGGLISVGDELRGWDEERVRAGIAAIPHTLGTVLDRAEASGVPPSLAADRLVEERLAAARR